MTNECVMHSVEPGQRPSRLIRLVNKAQVNLTTKTPSLLLHPTCLLCLGEKKKKDAGSRLDVAPRMGREGRREVCRGDRKIGEEKMG
ncbi:hypothetical protein VZT92_016875 [Zoarces viviparus]|uniref:Uncharacterized protein n=1 Tax=Zoarces viviparus TaxID=48416 RepID=A0AAW1EQM6_ZOAVI